MMSSKGGFSSEWTNAGEELINGNMWMLMKLFVHALLEFNVVLFWDIKTQKHNDCLKAVVKH